MESCHAIHAELLMNAAKVKVPMLPMLKSDSDTKTNNKVHALLTRVDKVFKSRAEDVCRLCCANEDLGLASFDGMVERLATELDAFVTEWCSRHSLRSSKKKSE